MEDQSAKIYPQAISGSAPTALLETDPPNIQSIPVMDLGHIRGAEEANSPIIQTQSPQLNLLGRDSSQTLRLLNKILIFTTLLQTILGKSCNSEDRYVAN